MNDIKKLERDKARAKAKGNWKEVGEICNYMGEILSRQGNFQDALLVHEEELEVSVLRNDTLGSAIAHRRLGECLLELGEFKRSLSHLKEYLRLAQQLGSDVELQRAFATLGRAYYYKHVSKAPNSNTALLSKAEDAFHKALELAEKLKGQITEKEYAEMQGRLFLNLGLVCDQREDIDGCTRSLKQAIYLSKKYDLVEDLHRCETSLAVVYQKRGQLHQALRLLDEALICAKQARNKALICDTLLSKSQVLTLLKDYESARTYLKKAYKIRSPVQEDHIKVAKNLKIVVVLCECESELLSIPSSDLEKRLKLYEKLGDGCAALGNFNQALGYYENMLKCALSLQKPDEVLAPIYFSLGETHTDCGQYKEALHHYYKELECRKNNPEEQCRTMLKIAEILELQGLCNTDVENAFQKAITFADKSKKPKLKFRCLKILWEFQKGKDMEDKANATRSLIDAMSKKHGYDIDAESSDEEDTLDIFDDVSLSDLSACTDSETENEVKDVSTRPRRPRQIAKKVNEVGETPLHRACITGNLKLVKRLVEKGHPVNPRDFCGWLPLHEACNHGFIDIVEYLLEKGAFINDRGGEKCDGITPLHDAASCGHLDIMKLLMSKGASVTARTNNGLTPLDCLREWRKRLGKELDNETRLQCLTIEEEMEEALRRVGQDKATLTARDRTSKVTSLTDAEEWHSANSSSVVEDQDETELVYQNPATNDLQKDFFDPKSACREYQSVMQGIRRRTLQNEKSSEQLQIKAQPSALLDEDRVINYDDWLEMDHDTSRKSTKRQCTRPPRQDATVASRAKRVKHLSPQLSQDDRECDADIFERNDEGDEWDNLLDATDDFFDDGLLVEDNCFDKPEAEANEQFGVEKDCEIKRHASSGDGFTTSNRNPMTAFCIKVKINERLLLIPVGEGKTVRWLAEEAGKRYSELSGTKQRLSLATEDGAVLSSDDLISSVLTNGERIVATIEEMQPLTLSEKYNEACSALNISPLDDVASQLISSDAVSVLFLEHMALPECHLNALSKTLQNYITLRELCLHSIPLSIEGITALAKSICSLPNLRHLSVCCCALTHAGLQALLNTSMIPGNQNSLKQLEIFNVGYNPLHDESVGTLASFLKDLTNLTSLDITACNFTSALLQSMQFVNSLTSLNKLNNLSMGLNSFDATAINALFHSVRFHKLTKLDLHAGVCYTSSGILGNAVSRLLSSGSCMLQELYLASCCLQDADLVSLAKTISNCHSLCLLDISNNPEVTADSIAKFVTSISSLCTLTLDIRGCELWTDQLWTALSKTMCHRFLRKFILTCDTSSCDFMKKVLTSWHKFWQMQHSTCHLHLPNTLELCANEI